MRYAKLIALIGLGLFQVCVMIGCQTLGIAEKKIREPVIDVPECNDSLHPCDYHQAWRDCELELDDCTQMADECYDGLR
ncbi:MAG: hypothetical protein GWN93_26995 [Deltaproteobacteria bacterium]|nr:hypothetical protein [Deltaproteobacteria bacterium]